MSELALVTSRRFKLEQLKEKGRYGAQKALSLYDNPTRFLSTVQIGITLIGILLGVYTGENLTADFTAALSDIRVAAPYAHEIATTMIVILITYLSIVLGELLPKRIGMTYPEPIILLLAGPMKIISVITSPFVSLLTFSNNLLLRILGIDPKTRNTVSEAEIKSIIKESAAEGEIEIIEQALVNKVFELGDRKVNTLYTPVKYIIFVDESYTWTQVLKVINKEKHTAYPVTKNENPDDIIGLLMIKNLFKADIHVAFNVKDYITEPMYVNETSFAYQILEQFKSQKKHHALVVDEFGTTKGLVTMDDVLEALVGNTIENPDQDYNIMQRDNHSWLIDGQYALPDFLHHFPVEISEHEKSVNATIAGLFISRTGTIPVIGQKILLPPYELEVIDKDGQRIDKFLLTLKGTQEDGQTV